MAQRLPAILLAGYCILAITVVALNTAVTVADESTVDADNATGDGIPGSIILYLKS